LPGRRFRNSTHVFLPQPVGWHTCRPPLAGRFSFPSRRRRFWIEAKFAERQGWGRKAAGELGAANGVNVPPSAEFWQLERPQKGRPGFHPARNLPVIGSAMLQTGKGSPAPQSEAGGDQDPAPPGLAR